MLERFIHHVGTERPPASESAAEARERLREKFPRAAVRRMTHLGLLVGSTLDGVEVTAADALVYATTYAETRALEDYLASFPHPSPLGFQTSIHPSGIQQVLIGRQRAVGRVWPLAGRARLVEQAWLTALLEPASRVLLIGGEERGTWLLEQRQASDRSFAFALVLTGDREGACGRIAFAPAADAADEPCPALPEFADAVAERRALSWRGAGGAWRMEW